MGILSCKAVFEFQLNGGCFINFLYLVAYDVKYGDSYDDKTRILDEGSFR